MLSGSEKGFRLMWSNREFKLHVYGKRQTSESSREFLKKIENEQIKTAQTNCVKQLI